MKFIAAILSMIFLLSACNSSDRQAESKSDNDLDAARNFLEAALKGDFKSASNYMLKDPDNLGYLTITENKYQHLDGVKKDSLRSASLRFYDTRQVNDSTTITIFANSYKNDKDTLKIVRLNGQWLVDLKYLFNHDMDTLNYQQKNRIDTVHK